jgi:PPOX class probable F420-dependent enzyme
MRKIYTAFEKQKYLNLETFRKSGLGVKAPVWFVQDGDMIFVRTITDSGKVKVSAIIHW